MTAQSDDSTLNAKQQGAIDNLSAAISTALDDAPVSDVLSLLTGAFVALTVELVRRKGHDVGPVSYTHLTLPTKA